MSSGSLVQSHIHNLRTETAPNTKLLVNRYPRNEISRTCSDADSEHGEGGQSDNAIVEIERSLFHTDLVENPSGMDKRRTDFPQNRHTSYSLPSHLTLSHTLTVKVKPVGYDNVEHDCETEAAVENGHDTIDPNMPQCLGDIPDEETTGD